MMKNIVCLNVLWLAVCLASFAETVHAGFMISGQGGWQLYSFEPLEEEVTPNYSGFGAGLHLGYSFLQVLDIYALARYHSGRRNAEKLGAEDTSIIGYGAGLALRAYKTLYFGISGLHAVYKHFHSRGPGEVEGTWRGPGGVFSLGTIFPVSKRDFWQINFEIGHAILSGKQSEDGKRRLNILTISIGYVFNDFHNFLIDNTLYKDFLRAL